MAMVSIIYHNNTQLILISNSFSHNINILSLVDEAHAAEPEDLRDDAGDRDGSDADGDGGDDDGG